jgi:hypothetical protein
MIALAREYPMAGGADEVICIVEGRSQPFNTPI